MALNSELRCIYWWLFQWKFLFQWNSFPNSLEKSPQKSWEMLAPKSEPSCWKSERNWVGLRASAYIPSPVAQRPDRKSDIHSVHWEHEKNIFEKIPSKIKKKSLAYIDTKYIIHPRHLPCASAFNLGHRRSMGACLCMCLWHILTTQWYLNKNQSL